MSHENSQWVSRNAPVIAIVLGTLLLGGAIAARVMSTEAPRMPEPVAVAPAEPDPVVEQAVVEPVAPVPAPVYQVPENTMRNLGPRAAGGQLPQQQNFQDPEAQAAMQERMQAMQARWNDPAFQQQMQERTQAFFDNLQTPEGQQQIQEQISAFTANIQNPQLQEQIQNFQAQLQDPAFQQQLQEQIQNLQNGGFQGFQGGGFQLPQGN